MSHLNIGHINIRSLKKYRHELSQFMLEHNIDIMSINETLLQPPDNPSFYGYTLHRTDNTNNKYMSVAILVRNSIPSGIQFSRSDNTLSQLTIKIKPTSDEHFHITSIYNRQRHVIPDATVAQLANHPKHFIIGDFNSRSTQFGDSKSTRAGDSLAKHLQTHSLHIHNDNSPTRIHHDQSTSILDLLISTADISTRINNFSTHFELPSDHLALTATLQLRPTPYTTSIGPSKISKFNTTRANWSLFSTTADSLSNNEQIPEPKTFSDINDTVDKLCNIIHTAANQAIPIFHPKHFSNKLPQHILSLIKQRKHFRRLHIKHKIQEYKTEANKLKYTISKLIKNHKRNQWTHTCNNLETFTDNPKKLYGMITTLTKSRNRSNIPALVDSRSPSTLAITDDEKAELFKHSLTTIHNPNFHTHGNHTHFNNITAKYHAIASELKPTNNQNIIFPTDDDPFTRAISAAEIISTLKKSKNTAPGTDRITYTMIKHLPESTLHYIADTLSLILHTGHIPPSFKKSLVILFPKPHKPKTNPLNYRPIHLINVLPKIMDKIIAARLNHFLNKHNKYNTNQSGFRPRHTTSDHPLHLHFTANTGFKQKQTTEAVFLDLSKAFDTVWVPGLIFKMYKLNIPTTLIRYIHNTLNNRTCTININNNNNHSYSPLSGVPQGSPLSPTLFNIYINDIPSHPSVHTKLFADDIAIYCTNNDIATANTLLQKHLDRISLFCQRWYLTINPDKTQHICFHRKRNVQNLPPITLSNTTIYPTDNVTYLGFHLNKSLKPHTHIRKQAQKTKFITMKLHSLHNKHHGPSPTLLSKMYKTLVRPIMEYGNLYTADSPKSHTNILKTTQHRFLTKIHRTPISTPRRYINTISGVQDITDRLTYLKNRTLYKHKHLNSPINKVITLTHTQPPIRSAHRHLIPERIPPTFKYKHCFQWPPITP